jgi:fibronectin-binding autotransporter adhesin
MKRTIKFVSKTIAAVAAATLLSAGLTARAAVISVNLTPFTGDAANIDADETFGIASEGTVVGGWVNFNRSGGDNLQGPLTASSLPFSDGSATTVNLSLTAPNSWANGFSGAYADTPLNQGLDDYTGTAPATSFTLTNLAANFPNGYKIIVYAGGFNANRGASISDGTTTFYYRVDPAPVTPYGSFSRTTQTTDLGATNNPIAQYAVFGDPVLLTANAVTVRVDALYNGGAGLCGFQVVGVSAQELTARIWSGNLNNNWDTETLNWTNNVFGTTNYAEGDAVTFNDQAVSATPTVNLTATRNPASVTVDGTKNYTFTGSGIGGAASLTKKGSGTLTLSNPNTYTGATVITAGTLSLGSAGAIPDGSGNGDVSIASGAILDLSGFSEGINGLSGAGTLDNTGGNATLTVGLDNDGGAFTGVIQGAVALTKQGTNSLILSGTSSHSGATVVAQGTLELNPLSSFSTSSTLVVSNAANLQASFTNGSGLFTSAGLSLNGGTALTIDYGNASITGLGTPITLSGVLNLNGVSQLAIKGHSFANGSYTLISYSSKTGGGSISSTPASLPPGMSATIQDNGSAIVLNVTAPSIQSLSYTFGDGGIWATSAGPTYWNLGGAEYTEYGSVLGDAVEFGTTYNGFPLLGGTVTLTSDVHPNSITAIGSYTLTGSGRITGATGITMAGATAATFILDNTNTFTGVATVTSGTLQINKPGALGSTAGGTVVSSGGSLALSNAITLTGEPLTLNGNGTSGNNGALRSLGTSNPVTVASPITLGSNARISTGTAGSELILNGPITDNGSNYTLFLTAGQTGSILRMNSANNVAGNVTVYTFRTNAGLMTFGVNNVFPAASLSVGGGLFDLNGTAQTFAGLLIGTEPTFGVLTNSSGSPSTLTINYSGTNPASLQSAISGLINIVKTGTGVQSFTGGAAMVHTYSGTTTINQGVLGIASDMSRVTNSFTVNSGGTLRGSGSAIGGPVTVNSGGTFYAGFASNAIGTLTISNNLSLAGDVIVALNKDQAQSNDVVNVTGALTYGGTLTILNLGSNALTAGDTFTVFPPGGTGSFSSIIPPDGATVSFANGVITVVSVSAGPTLNYTNLGGGSLQFDWTGSYKLQWQTNNLTTGLNSNWEDYPSGGTSPVNVTVNPAIPAAFFRLATP